MVTTRTSPKPLRVVVSYFGAKARLAPEIARQLGPHRARYEPFAGGLSVTFACPPCSNEVVNDLNGDVVNLAAVIASERWEDLRERLSRTLCCDGLVLGSIEALASITKALTFGSKRGAIDVSRVGDAQVEWAYHFAVASWLSRENGLIGARVPRTASRGFTTASSGPQRRLPRLVEALPWMHDRLRRTAIWSIDALSLIAKVRDEDGAVIYCDPPYLRATRPSSYLIDVPTDPMKEEAWHAELAEALRRFRKTRVVVSYYDHPLIHRLYRGWTIVPLKVRRIVGKADRCVAGSLAAPEVLCINGRPGATT